LLGLTSGRPTLSAQKTPPSNNQALMSQLHQAIVIADHGDENKALALTRDLLAQHPAFEPALKFQGALLEDLGHGPEAIASFQTALKLAPTDPELLFKVSLYQLQTGHNAEAISLLSRALKYTPRDRDTLYYLAQAYHLNGDNDLALKTIQECLKVDPNNASVWQKYGELLCSSGDNQAAMQWLLKAQQSDPTLARIDFDLGVASYRGMDLDRALEYSAQAAQRQPNDLTVQALLAAVYVKLGKWQDAAPIFQSILRSRATTSHPFSAWANANSNSRTISSPQVCLSNSSVRIPPRSSRTSIFPGHTLALAGPRTQSTRQIFIAPCWNRLPPPVRR